MRSWPERCEAIRPNLPLSPNLRGSLFMAVSMAAFTMNDSITKLMSLEMNFGQVMLVRGLFAIVLIGALAVHQGAIRPLRTLFVKPVALRVVGEVGGTVAFLAAISHLPLANTSAIMQSLPLAITLGAALTLREPVGWRRWSAQEACTCMRRHWSAPRAGQHRSWRWRIPAWRPGGAPCTPGQCRMTLSGARVSRGPGCWPPRP